MMARRAFLLAALVAVAAIAGVYAARELQQLEILGGLLGGKLLSTIQAVAVSLQPGYYLDPVLGPVLAFAVPNLGKLGILVTALSGTLSVDLTPAENYGYAPATNTPKTGPFLYVWNAYGKSYTDPLFSLNNKDFLVAIDLNPTSPTYSKPIHLEKLPNTGNEPHHISISQDRKRLLGGGLLSFLRLQDDAFLFDIETDPRTPKFLKSKQLLATAVTDHVLGLKNGVFLTTQMGAKFGGTPGGISTWHSSNLTLINTWPKVQPPGGNLDPHGADVNSTADLLITSDFVNPLSTVTAQVLSPLQNLPIANQLGTGFVPYSQIITRDTVRVWKLSNLTEIQKTIHLPGAQGVIDVKIIPGKRTGAFAGKILAYATGVFNGGLYLVDPLAGTSKLVLDFGVEIHPHLLAPVSATGDRFFLSLNKAGVVVYLDTSVPDKPKILQALSLGPGASPHYLTPIAPGSNTIAVADYFLDQGVIGAVHAGGNKKVYVLNYNRTNIIEKNTLVYDFGAINGRPHGLASNQQYTDVEANYGY